MSETSSRWWFHVLLIASVVAVHIHVALAGTTPDLEMEAVESVVVDGPARDHDDSTCHLWRLARGRAHDATSAACFR